MEKIKKQLIILAFWFLSLNLLFGSLYLVFYKNNFLTNFWLPLFLIGLFLSFFHFIALNIAFKEELSILGKKISFKTARIIIFFFSLFFLFFWFGFNAWMFLLFILLFLSFYFGSRSIEKRFGHSLKFSFLEILGTGKPLFLNGIALLVAFLVFLSPKILGGKIFLPRFAYDFLFPEIEKTFANKYPGFSGEMNIDEFVFLMVIQNPPRDFPIDKSEIKVEDYSQLKESFGKFKRKLGGKNTKIFLDQSRYQVLKGFGFSEDEIKKIKGTEKLNDFFYQIISKEIEKKSKIYQYFIGSVLGIVIISFLIVKFLLAILFLIFVPLIFGLFVFLRKLGVFKINLIKVNKEEIGI